MGFKRKGRGKGYNWDEGKSNNALEAEQKNLILAGKVSKEFACTTKFIQQMAPFEEWHHISGWFNKKRYYNIDKVKAWWELQGKQLWEKEQLKLEANNNKTGTNCKIRFREWIDRKTVIDLECSALIIKQGKALATFQVSSQVKVLIYNKKSRNFTNTGEISHNYKIGDTLTKKINFVED